MTLYQSPGNTIHIDGAEYVIDTDFRVWVGFYGIFIRGDDMEQAEKLESFLRALTLPLTQSAVAACIDFFGGESDRTPKKSGGASPRVCIDFEKDSAYIYAAFLEVYGIDLTETPLHWHKFLALFRALPETCQICRIMHYRAADLNEIPKSQRKHYRKMKSLYALNPEQQFDSAQEREQDMKRRADEIYRRAKERLERGSGE